MSPREGTEAGSAKYHVEGLRDGAARGGVALMRHLCREVGETPEAAAAEVVEVLAGVEDTIARRWPGVP